MTNNLIPYSPMNTSRIATIAGNSFKVLAVAFSLVLVVYILLVTWLHHNLADHAVSISQAAGAPADAERILNGILPWLLASAILPAFVRLAAESLNPFRSGSTVIWRIVLLMTLAIASALLPHSLRRLRGVDAQGLPVHMRQSNPADALWWLPNGTPVLFYSLEDDGSIRFWNRKGITPDTGTTSVPVTRETRRNWVQQRSNEAMEKERRQREDAEAKAKQEKDVAARILSATDELKHRAANEAIKEREEREAKHALDLKLLNQQREAEASKAERLVAERTQLQWELHQAREAQFQPAKTSEQRKNTPVSKAVPVTNNKAGFAWDTMRILPGKYLAITGYGNSKVEMRLPYECEIQVQGQIPRIYPPGTVVLSLPAPGNFRIRSRVSREFNILAFHPL